MRDLPAGRQSRFAGARLAPRHPGVSVVLYVTRLGGQNAPRNSVNESRQKAANVTKITDISKGN
jgi:hypothetical protein